MATRWLIWQALGEGEGWGEYANDMLGVGMVLRRQVAMAAVTVSATSVA